MTPIKTVLAAAEAHAEVKRVGGEFVTNWPAPGHPDEHPSCHIREMDDGTVVIKCRSRNCSFEDMAKGLGLPERDFFPPKPEKRKQKELGPCVATFLYELTHGKTAYKACRFQFPGSTEKTFILFRPDGNGKWIANLKDVERIPYRWPELLEADPSAPICIFEGERKVDLARDKLGVIATCNPGGTGGSNLWKTPAFQKAVKGRDIIIIPDHDEPGEKHAATVAPAIVSVAKSIKVVRLPLKNQGDDVVQFIEAGGTREQFLALVAAAPVWTPAPAEATVRRLRPEIEVGTDESRVVDEAIAALAIAPEVYVRGPEVVEIVTDTPATRGVTRAGPLVRIHRSPEPRVRELLSTYAQWMSTGRDGESLVEAHPPLWAVRAVVSRGHWPALRPLIAVAEAPTMRPDGTILTEPGYDPATGIYLAPGVRVTIPDHPTRDQAIAAVAELADIIGDFPLASEAGRSAWLAGVLTATVRPAIDGPAPMIIIDASVPGAGKTLMVDASAMITTGRPAARTTFVADDAEMRKRITAIALAGDPLALLDNVVGTIGCPSLDAALTGTTWRDRVLGSSAMTAELPMRTVWWATGNGLVIGADLIRRALLVRLEPMMERPEERTGWRHPRLLDHVRDVRAELLSAALTIPRAYVVAGRPDQRLTPMGSYTAWSDLVRSAVVWAGMADPCATVGEIRACDPRADALAGLLATWPAAPDAPATVAELLAAATPGTPWRAALCEWCPPRGADLLPVSRALGNRLRGVRRRVVGAQYIDAGPHGRGGVSWLLRATGSRLPSRDCVTPVTLVSRYACNEQVQNIDIGGRTVTTVTQSQGSDDGPDPGDGEGEVS